MPVGQSVSETAGLPHLEDEGNGGGGSAGPAVRAELDGSALAVTTTLGIITTLLTAGAGLLGIARVSRARLVLRVGLRRLVGLLGVGGALRGGGITAVGAAGLVGGVTLTLAVVAAGLDSRADLVGNAQSLCESCQPRPFMTGFDPMRVRDFGRVWGGWAYSRGRALRIPRPRMGRQRR